VEAEAKARPGHHASRPQPGGDVSQPTKTDRGEATPQASKRVGTNRDGVAEAQPQDRALVSMASGGSAIRLVDTLIVRPTSQPARLALRPTDPPDMTDVATMEKMAIMIGRWCRRQQHH
jgi:hypothetical protein